MQALNFVIIISGGVEMGQRKFHKKEARTLGLT